MIKQATSYNGSMKIRLEDLEPDAWKVVSGNEKQSKTLYPTVRRCLNYRKQSISSIPWKLTTLSGVTEFDSTVVDSNYPQIDSIINALSKIEQSMIMVGKAFYLISESRVLDPRSITVNWSRDFGIVNYTRKIGNEEITIEPYDIVYFKEDSLSETESGESIFDTIKTNVKVVASIDQYITQYFDNGTIKATILTTKADSYPTQEEVSKVENFLNRSIQGLKNAFKSIFLRLPVEATVVGSGLENFDPKLHDTEIMLIITAFEVPPSAILPSAANYATAMSDKRQYYETVAIPRIDYIFSEINNQWLKRNGLMLVSEGEKLPIFQTDESERSQSLSNLVNAGFDVLDAADILGYSIPDEIRNRMLRDRELAPMLSSFVFPVNDNNNQLTDGNLIDNQTTKTYLLK